MNEITIPSIIPPASTGNLTNLIAERAWFEPDRITMSRPLGDGWQPLTARQVEEEIRATAKGLIAAGIQIGDRVAIKICAGFDHSGCRHLKHIKI